jgi:hypothetical protein
MMMITIVVIVWMILAVIIIIIIASHVTSCCNIPFYASIFRLFFPGAHKVMSFVRVMPSGVLCCIILYDRC